MRVAKKVKLGLFFLIILTGFFTWQIATSSKKVDASELFNSDNILRNSEKLVKIKVSPPFKYKFNIMKEGVIQHIDRNYSYDEIPIELNNGLLFNGIHRAPQKTAIEISLLQPATIYFFYQIIEDGGYTRIFDELENWEKCTNFPKYDIHNGSHGLQMIMYKLRAKPGKYYIPPTTKENACFNILFQPET